jgi:hypothetical protein
MPFVDGYEKVTPKDKPPYAAQGTEKANSGGGPGPSWAKRPEKSDPGPQ